jgi:hypothetical protein
MLTLCLINQTLYYEYVGEVRVQLHHSWPRYFMKVSGHLCSQRKSPRLGLVGPQRRSGRYEEVKSLVSARNKTLAI